jgi:hypothetical protein
LHSGWIRLERGWLLFGTAASPGYAVKAMNMIHNESLLKMRAFLQLLVDISMVDPRGFFKSTVKPISIGCATLAI